MIAPQKKKGGGGRSVEEKMEVEGKVDSTDLYV